LSSGEWTDKSRGRLRVLLLDFFSGTECFETQSPQRWAGA